jgi:heterodisulfide reductase subunit A-like polyferredoxin
MLRVDKRLCGECGGCVAVCPYGALELLSSGLSVKLEICTLCENCVIFCPVGALSIRSVYAEAHPSQMNSKLKNG